MADARLTNTPNFNLESYVNQLARNLDNHAQVLHDRDSTNLLNFYTNPVYIGRLSGFDDSYGTRRVCLDGIECANNNQFSSTMAGGYGNLNAMFWFSY